jgi:ribosomal protein S9
MADNPPIRADALRLALARALTNVRLARHRLGLSEESRYRIADEVVDYLVRDGRWPELNRVSELRPLPDGSNDKRTR